MKPAVAPEPLPRATKRPAEGELAFRVGPHVFAGFALAVLLIVGCGGWAATAHLTGAVIAQGSITVDQKLKQIQHRDGGIVSEIAIRQGDFVREGQVLLRLDDVQTRAELSIVRSQMAELTGRRARLIAERDNLSSVPFPEGLREMAPEAGQVISGETRLFEGNRISRESQKEQLGLEIAQVEEEIRGLEAQKSAKLEEIVLVEKEFLKLKSLADRGLIETPRVYTAERELTRLLGERGEIEAGIARAKARMSTIRLQILAIDQNARTEAQRELSIVEANLSELEDRRVAIEDRLSRTDIRAPLSGTVNELTIHTIGGVITPAETLVTIVPDGADLKIEVKLSPADIDQVTVGQSAKVRFSAFSQRTTPELEARVVHISPATTTDPATGAIYYLGEVEITDEIGKLGGRKLLPGMPVEVFVSTEPRTAISYLMKPVMDQFNRAFREE